MLLLETDSMMRMTVTPMGLPNVYALVKHYGIDVLSSNPALFVLQHKNHDSSCGMIINLDQPAQKDCVLVEVLKRQGAIPFVKTNVPQAMLK